MIPCLYGQNETNFLSNGIGKLSDAISCSVIEKRNGSYELTLTYPSEGIHAENLIEENIIVAKPSEHGNPQPFRIYKVTTLLNGVLELNGRHIQYQQNQITVSPFTAHGAQAAMAALRTNAATNCPFSFTTDITKTDDFTLKLPSTIRNCLGNMENSILDLYGGEFEWDMYTTILHANRGTDNGVRIVYGKNLIDFQMEKSIESMVTGVHPYWYKQDDDTGAEIFIELPEKIMSLNLGQTYEKIEILDCSSIFSEQPTLEEIRDYARWYLQDEKFSRPDADITINFVQLWQTPGYEDIAEAESVSLCDTVHVYIAKLNTSVSYKVTETNYNVLLERYNEIILSNANKGSRNKRNSFITNMTSLQSQAAAAFRNSNSNSTKLKQLSYKFADEVNGLYSELEMTAAYLRTQFRNEHDQLTSKFEQTAEHFQWSLEDAKRQLTSEMELTAYHLQTEFDDGINDLHSTFEITAAHLQTQFEDRARELESSLELTAEHLQMVFDDKLCGFKSEFELNAQHMQASFTDRINLLESTFELNAAHLRTEFYNQVEGLQSEFEVNARNLNYATTKADENGNILAKAGLYIGIDGNIAYNYNAINGVGTQFQQHADAIGTVVGTYNGRYYIKAGEVVDSINAQTGQTVHKVDMDMITLRSGAIIKAINGGGSNASELTIDFDKLNLTSGTVIKLLNGGQSGDSSLKIEADKLELSGLATVAELNAEKGRFDNLISGITHATSLTASTLQANTILNVKGTNFVPRKLKIGSIISSTVLSSSQADLDYDHYHDISVSESGGVVTITTGKARLSAGTDSFNIADTQFFKNGVSAARIEGYNSVTIDNSDIVRDGSDDYNSSTHDTTIYIEATASNGAQGTQSFVVSGSEAYYDGHDDGYSSGYDSGYYDGQSSVTQYLSFYGYEKQSDGDWESVDMDQETISLLPGEYSNVCVEYYNYSASRWVTKMGKYEGAEITHIYHPYRDCTYDFNVKIKFSDGTCWEISSETVGDNVYDYMDVDN